MEKKTRYCASCGNKTNDSSCEICGRATKPITMSTHERELDLLIEDTILNQKDDFSGDQGHHESKQYHHAKKESFLHVVAGEHPYYDQNEKVKGVSIDVSKQALEKLLPALVAIIIVVVAFVIGMSGNEDASEYETIAGLNGNFYEYATEQDNSVNIICSIDSNQIVLSNDTRYYIDGEVIVGADSAYAIDLMQPFSSLVLPLDRYADSCRTTVNSVYLFDFHDPNIQYHIEETQEMIRYDIEGNLDVDDIEELLMHTLPSYVQFGKAYGDIMIYVQKEHKYQALVDVANQVNVTLQPVGDTKDAHFFSFDFSME